MYDYTIQKAHIQKRRIKYSAHKGVLTQIAINITFWYCTFAVWKCVDNTGWTFWDLLLPVAAIFRHSTDKNRSRMLWRSYRKHRRKVVWMYVAKSWLCDFSIWLQDHIATTSKKEPQFLVSGCFGVNSTLHNFHTADFGTGAQFNYSTPWLMCGKQNFHKWDKRSWIRGASSLNLNGSLFVRTVSEGEWEKSISESRSHVVAYYSC